MKHHFSKMVIQMRFTFSKTKRFTDQIHFLQLEDHLTTLAQLRNLAFETFDGAEG